MAWKNLQTGIETNYLPQDAKHSEYIHLTDQTGTPGTGMPDTFEMGKALGADPRFRRFLLWCFGLAAVALALFVAYVLVQIEWNKLMRQDIAAHKGKPTIVSASEIKWSTKLFYSKGTPYQVGGPDAFITGDVDGLDVDAFSNLTVQGDVTNSRLTAYNTLTVGNVSNTTLRAHHIVVTGRAVNVKQIITRPLAKP